MRSPVAVAVNRLLPRGTRRRHVVNVIAFFVVPGWLARALGFGELKTDKAYQWWVRHVEPRTFARTAERAAALADPPTISVVVPAYNTPEKYLRPLIDCLLAQVYPHWELCLADGSSDDAAAARIAAAAAADPRIRYRRLESNEGISGNTNQGVRMATGEFVGLLDHDDVLSPYALAEVALAVAANPDADLLYTDEDKLSEDGGKRFLPFFKPGWSPDMLLGGNYVTHFTVVRRSLLDALGGERSAYDGAQDFDLVLRAGERARAVVHIPRVLYHWRLAEGSTAVTIDSKGYAADAGRRAVADALARRGATAEVLDVPKHPTNYRVRYALPADPATGAPPTVSIVVPFKDKVRLTRQCVESVLDRSTYPDYEVVLVSNQSVEPATHAWLASLTDPRVRVHHWDHPFNYSAITNFGRAQARGEYLILLNNDTEVISPDWIEELVGVASQPGVGAVGPCLLYPRGQGTDKIVQHAGVVVGMTGMAGHPFRGRLKNEYTFFGTAEWPRDFLAVTGACAAIKASRYDEAGGLDETFTVNGSDVALGIRLHESGHRNVYWPYVELRHHESASVHDRANRTREALPGDVERSLDYYRPYLDWRDPYFNANLDLMYERIRLRGL